ncbi:MAG TPA: SDR family NAD(P)-dependent oxidoreductase, partial [Gemmatimonadaceae bacterium]|nr:SDR family NAD(P)-dependent oxidoreductase [Gemmatimonadaceae bacterium]
MTEMIGAPQETLDLFRLNGRVAIVTGAAGLLGEQHSFALSDAGAHVVLADRKLGPCVERAAVLQEKTGVETLAVECDVTNPSDWAKLLDTTRTRFGRVDILVNNAAFTTESRSANYDAPFEKFPLEDWNQILAVNLTGVFLGCQVVGAAMLQQRSGSIVNMGSMYAVVSPNHVMYPGTGIAQPPAYSVSKAGVVALTRYLGTLWAPHGVRVNALTPGGVFNGHSATFTERFDRLNPMARMALPH